MDHEIRVLLLDWILSSVREAVEAPEDIPEGGSYAGFRRDLLVGLDAGCSAAIS
jgi:hypothetical protein